MAQVCPSCGALVGEESQHCASCGAELDPFLTIQPPKFHGGGAPPRPHREVSRESAAPPEPAPPPAAPPQPSEAPPRPPKPKVRRVPPPAAPAPAPPAPRAVPSPPQPYAAPPITPPTPPPQHYAPPAYAPPPSYGPPPPAPGYPAAPNPAASPGRFRKRLIEMLGGKADAAAAAGPPPSQQPYAMPAPPPQAFESWPPHGAVPSPQYGPPPVASAPAPPPPAFPAPPAEDEDDGLTRMMVGANLAKLKIPTHLYTLQILDRSGQWQPWSMIGTSGLKVGRTERSSQFPELNTMATRHLKLSYDGTRLLAEDQGTLNGVFLKISQPIELREGVRFRVGGHLIEFREATPVPSAGPLRSEDGEEFWSSDLQPLAFLDFIRPDGTMGLRYPISKTEPTILGRGSRPGKPVDVALPNDDWVSGQHAQVRQDGGRFVLEDLHSRNGTFLRTESTAPVTSGDVLLVGRVLLRVMEAGH